MLTIAALAALAVLVLVTWKRCVFFIKKTLRTLLFVGLIGLALAGGVLAVLDAIGGASLSAWSAGIAALLFLIYKLSKGLALAGSAADVLDDARSLARLARPFEPTPYIQKVRKSRKDVIFMGLDERRKPVLFPRAKLTKNHIEILGESGVGKSSLAGVLLSQLATAGECVVIFDPKADRMLPGVLARVGAANGFPVINIDLRYGQPAQINPFFKARQDQVEELLQVALDLGKTGQGGVDFYRAKDREATGWMAAAFADGETSMPELLEKAAEDDRVTENENLWREFRQVARIPAFQVHQGQAGHDLEQLLSRPSVIYVTGSTTKLEVQAGQKLMLQRILQILDERADQSMPVAVFLDELKYILSPAALRAAGTIRDRNCHLIFAHQSLGDLSDCPGLDPKAVRGAVWGNCGIKIAYKMLDADTARELSIISGERATTEARTSDSGGKISLSKSIGKSSHMPPHVFTHLPKPTGLEASVGVIIGDGPARFLSTRWLPAGDTPQPIAAPPLAEPAPPPAPADIAPTADESHKQVTPADAPPADESAPAQPDSADILAADFDDFLK